LAQQPTQAASADSRRRLLDLWRLSQAAAGASLDVMFFPSTYTYFPVPGRAQVVAVIHDATAERLPRLIFPTLTGRLAWTAKQRLACWQARRVVTVSHAAARSIRHYLPVPPERLRVVYEAADPIFQPRESASDRARQAALLARLGIPRSGVRVLYV